MDTKEFYTNILDHKIYLPSNYKTYIYPKSIKTIFTDPITHEYFSDPVIFNNNIYDKTSLIRWFSYSDLDPLTGLTIEPQSIILYHFYLFKYIIYSLEELEDCFIFYSVPSSIRYAQDIARYLPYDKYEKSSDIYKKDQMYLTALIQMRYPDQDQIQNMNKIKHLDMYDLDYLRDKKILEDLSDKKISCCSDTLVMLSLEELLFTDIFTGLSYKIDQEHDVYLLQSGYIITSDQLDIQLTSADRNSKKGYLITILDGDQPKDKSIKKTSIKKILEKFYIEFKDIKISGNKFIDFNDYNKNFYKSNVSNILEVRSSKELMYIEYLSILDKLTEQQLILIKKLSNIVNNENIKQKNYGRCSSYLEQLRTDFGIPNIIKNNMYGIDLSLLDLSKRVFQNHEFKDYCFVGTNLKNTSFINCKFMCCSFVGACLDNTSFISCKLSEPVIYGIKLDKKIRMIRTETDRPNDFQDLVKFF